jgi:hypothetical protein
VFRAEVPSALESVLESALDSTFCVGWADVHLILCHSRASAESLRCHLDKEGIRASGFDEA